MLSVGIGSALWEFKHFQSWQRVYSLPAQNTNAAICFPENNIDVIPKLPFSNYVPPLYTGPTANEVLKKRKEFLSPSTYYFYEKPVSYKRQNIYIWQNLNNYPSIKFRATNFVFSCFGDFSTIIICVYVFSCFRAFSAINRKEWRKRIHVTDSKYIYWQQGLTSFEDKIWTNKFVYAHRYCIIGKKFCQKSHCYPWYLIIVLILGLDEKIISSDVENYR